ncbi:MAG: thiamine diphosphokinase [Ilumatobacteraceae bacterium]|jgi:thiamine pyrophosphokinase|nr:thiamine diphosphokinase [Ilumatobacteraceae bacterium]
MHDHVVIVTGSEPLGARAVAAVGPSSILIAADGGLDHALAAGLTPAHLVGDLDSVSAAGLAWAKAHAIVERHPTDKDRTDTELAVERAASLDPGRLTMISGGGDRLDHTFAAIGALGSPVLTSIPVVEAWWGGQHLRVLHGPSRTTIRTRPGYGISLLALHGGCTGVSITGTRWVLDRVDLAPMAGHGVSNLAEATDVEITVVLGVLTVFVERPEVSA